MTRPSGPRVFVVLVALAVVGYAFVIAPRLARHDAFGQRPSVAAPVASPTASGPPPVFPAAGRTFIGVTTTEGVFNFAPVDAFARAVHHQPAVMMFSQGWSDGTFNRGAFDAVAQRGMLPVLSWEPWDYTDYGGAKDGSRNHQPMYQLSRITAGDFDGYLRRYAKGVKSLGYYVGIRLAHEMNGFWYPWGVAVNGNQPGDFVKMWRHVHDIFASAGATNVIWIWSPNVTYAGAAPLAPLYPGDAYVDWLGMSGYNGTAGTVGYRTPATIFDMTIKEMRRITTRPVVITETASTDMAGVKSRWIGDLAAYLPLHPEIIGVIWYEAVRETDWRIASSAPASRAFAQLAADTRYSVTWSTDVRPRTTVDTVRSPAPTPSRRPAAPTAGP